MLFDAPGSLDGITPVGVITWKLIEPGDDNPRRYLWKVAPLDNLEKTKLFCFDQEFAPERYNFRSVG